MDVQTLEKDFIGIFGENKNPIKFFKAPGRINLLGEHTDYNNGFVLPVAVDRFVFMAGRQRKDGKIILYAKDKGEKIETDSKKILPHKNNPWVNYLLGVYLLLNKKRHKLKGVEIFFTGEVPVGKGLSSSAALEIATCCLLSSLFNISMKPTEAAKLCQKAENEFVEMPCGIMDQFVSLLGKKENAPFIDCKDLSYKYVPISSANVNIIVADSGIKRELTSSSYAERKNECQSAIKILKKVLPNINSLRDISTIAFKKYAELLPQNLRKRLKHVVFENERVIKGINYLEEGKLAQFGQLMFDSHNSLRDNYEVSCRELDTLTEISRNCKGVLGAKMTGAGFGGSVVILAEKKRTEEIKHVLKQKYLQDIGINPEVYICDTADGAGQI